LCWHKSIFERFFSFHTKDKNRLKTNCTTSKRRRYVRIFELSIYRILWFENSLIKKSWFRFCCFSHCIIILKEWFFLSFFWVSNVLRVRIVLIIVWCRFVEWFFQSRRRFEFVSKQSKNVNFFLRRIDLYYADETFVKSRRFVDRILIAAFFVNDRWQSEKTIRNFIEIQIHQRRFFLFICKRRSLDNLRDFCKRNNRRKFICSFSRILLHVCVTRRFDVQNRFVFSYDVQFALLRRFYVALKTLNRMFVFAVNTCSMIDRDSTILCWMFFNALFAFFRIFACLVHMIISLIFEALFYAIFFLEVLAN
jgi:hypothetical protein